MAVAEPPRATGFRSHTERPPRIGIVVVAYNAASTLAHVLSRIPDHVQDRVEVILVCDDFSHDETYEVGQACQINMPELPIQLIRRPRNLGYGGNQKAAYRWAIDHGLDIVVLLHGDGQYAPECMGELLAPLEAGECSAVFGSRMLDKGAARRGGMPYYKLAGNQILTRLENRIVGQSLSEWHSGYRAYAVEALRAVPFEVNSDNFNFDTQIIIQLCEAGLRIVEVPIATYYGDEICYVNGMGYARDVMIDVLRYRANKMGFGTGNLAFASDSYELKDRDNSSHRKIMEHLTQESSSKILDLGCSDGKLSAQFRTLGHKVTGIDLGHHEGVEENVERFIPADLDAGLPLDVGCGYDLVIAADILEHLRRPEALLREIRLCMKPSGSLLVSIPNFSHWYPRLRVLAGMFDYDRRGILDATHLRFFTRRSFDRLVRESGFVVVECEAIGIPTEILDRKASSPTELASTSSQRSVVRSVFQRVESASVRLRPNLFASQYVYKLALQPDSALTDNDEGYVVTRSLPRSQQASTE